MGLGRPGLPLAVLDVRRAAAVVAWSAQRFADAPPVANLLDDRIISRRQLLDEFRAHGWNGRMVWVPIWFLSAAFSSARTLLALKSGRWPEPLAVYAVLRARRFDTKLSHTLFAAAEAAELQPRRAPALVASGGR